jgi:hypothetical protein
MQQYKNGKTIKLVRLGEWFLVLYSFIICQGKERKHNMKQNDWSSLGPEHKAFQTLK